MSDSPIDHASDGEMHLGRIGSPSGWEERAAIPKEGFHQSKGVVDCYRFFGFGTCEIQDSRVGEDSRKEWMHETKTSQNHHV